MYKKALFRIKIFWMPFVWAALLIPMLMQSCQSEQLITNPGDKLEFSQDTVSFDTLFSTVGTPTVWLKVRNVGNNPILIRSIRLSSSGSSGFRLNLDGTDSTRFENVEIPAKDSLFLFVSLRTQIQNTSLPVKIEDAVLFETDDPTKRIVLNAWSWDATFLRGKVFDADTTLTDNRPYVIHDSLVVAKNVQLTLQPGVQLYFHDKAFLKVEGKIVAIGNKEKPIRFRGDRLDKVISTFPYDFYPGQWEHVYLAPTSTGNQFEYVDIHGAYYGIIADSVQSGVQLTMRNCTVHNMINTCIWNNTSTIDLANCQITNSGSYTVALIGGTSSFIHCTIANHQWIATREGPALIMVNNLVDSEDETIGFPYPLYSRFLNCIVSGSSTTELGFNKNNDFGWDVEFDHCLLKTDPIPATLALTKTCLFNVDPKFLKLGFSSDNYVCDFRIDSISPAKDAGSIATLPTYRFDKNGVSRATDGKPDIGAYEWFEDQK